MPKEDRRIIFSHDEVYKAAFALCSQKQLKKPPPGAVEEIREDESDKNKLILDLVNPSDRDDPKATVEYSRDFLAAALLLFCRGAGIPIPKSARKAVILHDGDVILRVQIG